MGKGLFRTAVNPSLEAAQKHPVFDAPEKTLPIEALQIRRAGSWKNS